jgi:phage terminase large subunit-like protein
MPWQRESMDVALEIDPATGMLAYREVDITVPRQSGKTTEVLSLVLHRALACGNRDLAFGALPQSIVYGAQTGKDARKKWEDDWLPILEKSRFKGFYHRSLANGREGLKFANGSRQGLIASSEDSGHGGTLDLGIDDEAFAQKDARREQACVPAMNTRAQPQWWVISTAGTPTKSPYLYAKVQRGRKLADQQVEDESKRRGVCYIEYSAPEDADPFNPRVWWDCMPALGYTVTEETVRAALDTMLADPKLGLSEFRRAYLNQWVLAMGDPIVPLDHWKLLARPDAARPEHVVLGLSVAPQDESACVVALGRDADGELQSSVVEHGEGVDWLLPSDDDQGALSGLVERYGYPDVVVDEKACAHLLPEIERVAGFDRVIKCKSYDMPTACAFWLRLCQQKHLLHRDEQELTTALAAAERRIVLDGWALSQTKSGADITPLVAQILAAWSYLGSYGDGLE